MFLVILTYQRPIEEVDALVPAHLEWLQRHYDTGLFVASGRRVPRTGGVILARAGDAAAVQAAVADDPFVVSGVARAEVVEFQPSRTAAGFEALLGT